MKAFFLYFLTFCSFLIFLAGNSGCANIVPPAGGPRDSLPPLLVEAEPADSTTNFKGSIIRFHFNEYVDLQDVSNNLLFTPLFEVNPEVSVRLRTVTVRLRDTLEPNTTYKFNFGNAIKDFNEGNVLKNFTYTFTTGPALDSFELKGKVLLAENSGIDTTLAIILHRNLDDSAVIKERPRYVAKLDGQGQFHFTNLPAGTFAIYALGDAGTMRRYQNKKQLFAFADSPVIINNDTRDIVLYAYRETEKTPAASPLKTTPRSPAQADKRLKYTTNLSNNQQDLLTDLQLVIETPLRTFDTSKMKLTVDSTFLSTSYTTSLDSTRKIITIKSKWLEGRSYNLVLEKTFADDTLGRALLKSDTVSFTTKKLADYGNVVIKVRKLENIKNPVLQFVQANRVVFSTPLVAGSYRNPMFNPGEYELRILDDRNGNGQWDPGDFFGKKQQPEIAFPLNRKITVKPKWDNEFEVSL